jgi:regulatory protein
LRSSTQFIPCLFPFSLGRIFSGSRFPLDGPLWHKKGVKAPFKARRAPPPLTGDALQELALRYVGKYATTRAKLRSYLSRKLRERGWDGEHEPSLDALAQRFAELGYIDDAAYALNQSRSLSNRGYGKRRLSQKLLMAGVDDRDRAEADAHADSAALDAALRFAERRRIGPFATAAVGPSEREKWIAAMVRAGHGFGIAREIAWLSPGAEFDLQALRTFTECLNAKIG